MARPATLDHLRSRKKPTTQTVDVVLDPELADVYNEAKAKVDLLEMRARSQPENEDTAFELNEAERGLAHVQTQLDEAEAVVTFTFKSLPPHEYDALVNEHQPTPEQRRTAKASGDRATFNGDTFPQALVAACLIEPTLSLDEVQGLWKDENWNSAELQALFVAALQVNSSRRTVDLPKG